MERDLRGVVVGRKNQYGSRSERGTQVAATLYSLTDRDRHPLTASSQLVRLPPRPPRAKTPCGGQEKVSDGVHTSDPSSDI